MSDRPSEHHPSERLSKDGGNNASPTAPPSSQSASYEAPRLSAGARSVTSPLRHQPQRSDRTFDLPPLPQPLAGTGSTTLASATRLAGVSSILNLPQADESQPSRRRKATQLESPASSVRSLPPIASNLQPAISVPPASTFTQQTAPSERPPRRILTPRSPSLHRAASLNQLNPSAGTFSAQTAPFLTSPRSRTYTVEPGTSVAPPLPTPPAATRQVYGFPLSAAQYEPVRRESVGGARRTGMSSSASPSTSYSSYSHAQTSPATQFAPITMATLAAPYMASGDPPMNRPETASAPPSTFGQDERRSMGIPISSSGGQNAYQMMTLETTSGTVQLPVDIQAASRVADEKRKRNAGASARFRQRRKEKEKEASTSISRLEQQLKDLGEDAEFYKRERDFMAGILAHVPGGGQHFPRPQSPRHRRSSITSLQSTGGSASGGYVPGQSVPPSPESGRHVRRRTSTFSLQPPPQVQMPPSGVPIQPGPGPLAPQPPSSGPQQMLSAPFQPAFPRSTLPAPQMPFAPLQQQQQQPPPPPPPPQVLHALPQTGPWNPYAPERRPPGSSGQPPRDSR